MKVEKQMYDYLELTRESMKPKTWDTHKRFTQHLLEGFKTFGIDTLEDVDINTGYMLVGHYKRNTTNGNNSINKNLNYLKAVMRHYEIYTSFHKFKLLKLDSEPFRRFSHEELKKIITFVRDMEKSDNSLVYRTFVYLALDSGMRKQELLKVKIRNIDFDKNVIYLEDTKTGIHRYAPFSDFSKHEIKELIKFNSRRKYLFYNILKDRPLSSNDIRLFYRRLRFETNIDRIHTHRFRKTFASLLADNGMPLQYIQKLLDHKSVKTTMVYVQFDGRKPLESYNKFNNWHVTT